jgi:hypothetical protein
VSALHINSPHINTPHTNSAVKMAYSFVKPEGMVKMWGKSECLVFSMNTILY